MKLFTFMREETTHLGVQTEHGALDISSALTAIKGEEVPQDIMEVIGGGEQAIATLQVFVDNMTLVPGDIILTGTPEGVIMGYPEHKQVYLQDGDVVTVEIEKLGSLTNRMVSLNPH